MLHTFGATGAAADRVREILTLPPRCRAVPPAPAAPPPMSGDAPSSEVCYHDIVITLGIEANTTAMAVAQAIGTRERGATCRICGQPALPVVRLCAQCKAALKRVRHDTVSQHMPMTRRARGGDRARRDVPRVDADGGEHRDAAGVFRGVRAPIAVAALVSIVGSAGYFIVQQIHAAMPPEVSAAARTGSDRVSVAPVLAAGHREGTRTACARAREFGDHVGRCRRNCGGKAEGRTTCRQARDLLLSLLRHPTCGRNRRRHRSWSPPRRRHRPPVRPTRCNSSHRRSPNVRPTACSRG